MSSTTYSTGHSQFFLVASYLEEAATKLESELRKQSVGVELDVPWPTGKELLVTLLRHMGMTAEFDEAGNCIDISTETGRFPLEYEAAMLAAFAPYVREGSHLVFFGGDENMCWALSWDRDKTGKMEGRSANVIAVMPEDLHIILRTLRALKITILVNLLERKYGDKLGNHPADE